MADPMFTSGNTAESVSLSFPGEGFLLIPLQAQRWWSPTSAAPATNPQARSLKSEKVLRSGSAETELPLRRVYRAATVMPVEPVDTTHVSLAASVPGVALIGLKGPNVVFFSTPPYHGTLTRWHLHPAQWLHKLPDNVSFEEGALCEPLAVALAGLERADVKLGDPLLIA